MNNKISWTDQTWNPIIGCSRISPGCRGCYAARMAKRQAGMARAKRAKGQDPGRSAHYEKVENWNGVALVPEALNDPLRWRKPRRVFVCSMGDLFHEDVPFSYIREVWDKMHSASQHTFQILTKRPGRMLNFLTGEWLPGRGIEYPLPNVHLGVTAEDQQRADERIPLLLQTPAAFRFVSLEPLLGAIDLDYESDVCHCGDDVRHHYAMDSHAPIPAMASYLHEGLSLVIVGGETGPGARPLHPAWARGIRDQCKAAGVGFHFKSWGEWVTPQTHIMPTAEWDGLKTLDVDGVRFYRLGAKTAGHLLDGKEYRDL